MNLDDATRRAQTRYSTVAIILHWLIAAALIFEVGLGLRMQDVHGAARFAVFQLHKSVGITILLLVLLRLAWRFHRTPPEVAATGWERTLARIVHGLFYLLLFALPISGWVTVSASRIVVPTLLYSTIPWPDLPGLAGMAAGGKAAWHDAAAFIHKNLVTILYGLLALHVAGALKHHFLDRDGDMARMAPGIRTGSWSDPRLILIALGVILTAGLGLWWAPIGPGASVAARKADARHPASTPPPPLPGVPVAEPLPSASATAPGDQPARADQAAPQGASTWAIAKGSTLGFRTTWSGDAIKGGFSRFDGEIVFGPDDLDHSHVEIKVQTGSVFSGDGQRDETLKSADWFAVSSYSVATFKADRFRRLGPARFMAKGSLTLKGVTLPVSFPFTLTIIDDLASMRGTATLDRTAFGIGEGDYASTTEIPAFVQVDVAVRAKRKP